MHVLRMCLILQIREGQSNRLVSCCLESNSRVQWLGHEQEHSQNTLIEPRPYKRRFPFSNTSYMSPF